MRTITLFIVLFAVTLPPHNPQARAEGNELSIAAASDLVYAFQELGKTFEQRTNIRIRWIFGSSGVLSTQIQGGMDIDLFASASPEWLDRLEEKGLLLEGSRRVFALGRIALCTPKRLTFSVIRLEDLVEPLVKRIALANPSHAPYGLAGRESLERTDIWERVKGKIVYGESALQAQVYVRKGEVEAGILPYALVSVPEIQSHLIAADLHRPIRQTLALLKKSKKPELAQKFVQFLEGEEGKGILAKYGYSRP